MKSVLVGLMCVLVILVGCTSMERLNLRYGATEEIRQQPPLIEQAVGRMQDVVDRVGNEPAKEASRVYRDVAVSGARIEALDDGLPSETPSIDDLPAVKQAQALAADAAARRPTASERIGAATESARDVTGLGLGLAEELLLLAGAFGIPTAAGVAAVRKAKKKSDEYLDTVDAQQERIVSVEDHARQLYEALVGVVQGIDAAKRDLPADAVAKLKAILKTSSRSPQARVLIEALREGLDAEVVEPVPPVKAAA